MPWRGPEYDGDFPSLGYQVADWIQDNCVVPDRENAGEPLVLTDEQLRFLLFHYRIDPATGRFRYERGSQVIRPRKWGKAPLTAALVCAEAAGPVLFDGWDAKGEPVGRPWPTPWIQCVACSEAQVANVWRVLLPMIKLGSLEADIPDTGDTRINLISGGRIEPVTASARSRFGQRTTFAAMDETHLWLGANGGLDLAETLTSNLAGTSGRFIETTNAYDPVENSVAQQTFESQDPHVFYDDAPAPDGSVRDRDERDAVLRAVYGDSLRTLENPQGWVDPERLHVEIAAMVKKGVADRAEREFLNRKNAMEGAAFDMGSWKAHAAARSVPNNETIVIGVDGARRNDALAIVACEVRTGYLWPLDIIERPEDAGDDYVHDRERVDKVVREAFDTWDVWRLYADPQHLDVLIAGWSNSYGDKRVVEWATYRQRPIAWAVREFTEAVAGGEVTHPGDETLDKHMRQSRKRMMTVLDDKERPMHTLAKDSYRSPRKIDGAMAAVLAWQARSDAIQSGVYIGDATPATPAKPVAAWQPGRAVDPRLLSGGRVEQAPMGSFS